ncbi:MAG: DUF5360 family protein [Hyphomicrobiales bacterium]
MPFDIILSVIGLAGVRLAGLGDARWQSLTIFSVTMRSCAGLMAISIWRLEWNLMLLGGRPTFIFSFGRCLILHDASGR